MRGAGDRLLGSAEHFSFEQRIFNFVMLLGIALTVFGTAMDVYYGGTIWVDMAFVVCWVVTYHLSRFGNRFKPVSVISLFIFVFAFIPYEWIVSGGTPGAIPYYTILFMAVVAMILGGRLRTLMVTAVFAINLLLTGYDIFSGILSWNAVFNTPIHQVVVLAAMALLIVVYSNTYKKEKQRSEDYAQTIAAHVRQQQYYVENLEQLIGRLKSERHDFNNHLSVIHGLLESGETDKAKSYASELVKDAAEYQSIVFVPYPALRALLNHKLSSARDSGIELRLDVNLPKGLSLSEFDLAAILGNLVDNAMEACARISGGARYIDLTLKYQPDYLVVRIGNPFLPAPAGKRSAKPDPENHGFGLKNVAHLVSKHNGFMEIKRDNGVFEVDIALLVE